MPEIETVTEVLEPQFKVITSKKTGKTYPMDKVTTDKGHVLEVFSQARVGDKHEVEWDATYSQWKSLKKITESSSKQDAIFESLKNLYDMNKKIYDLLIAKESMPKEPRDILPDIDDVDDEERQRKLDEIPF